MIRKKVFEEIDRFNDEIFLYGEELDLSLKLKKKGYKIQLFPSGSIIHYGGAASEEISFHKFLALSKQSTKIILRKHFPFTWRLRYEIYYLLNKKAIIRRYLIKLWMGKAYKKRYHVY